MPEEQPTWTLEEARAYLPRLAGLLRIIRRAADLAVRSRGNGHSTLDGVSTDAGNGAQRASSSTNPSDEIAEVIEDTSPRDALEELTEKGIILRDPARGLVDFPTRHPNGRVILLCWLYGEEDISWWHLPEDGFAGRRPLPVPPHI